MAFTPRPSECKTDTSRTPAACQAQGRPGRAARWARPLQVRSGDGRQGLWFPPHFLPLLLGSLLPGRWNREWGRPRQGLPSRPCSQISCEAPVMMQGVAPSPPGLDGLTEGSWQCGLPHPPPRLGSSSRQPLEPSSLSCTARASGSFPASPEGSRPLHLHRKVWKRPWGQRRPLAVSDIPDEPPGRAGWGWGTVKEGRFIFP